MVAGCVRPGEPVGRGCEVFEAVGRVCEAAGLEADVGAPCLGDAAGLCVVWAGLCVVWAGLCAGLGCVLVGEGDIRLAVGLGGARDVADRDLP